MKTKEFGTTGLKVSEIGFGGSRIGGILANKGGSQEALRVLQKALDGGITFYDTADMYSQGESETLIGKAFRDRRDQVVLASKGGYCLPARRKIVARIKPLVRPLAQALGITRAKLPSAASGALLQDFSPPYLTQAVEGSLRRLRTDYIDLYQLHSPGAAFLRSGAFGEALETLEKLKGQGKVRFYGIATEVADDVPLCLPPPGISSVQLAFGLLDLEALEAGILAEAAARGLGVIARGCYGGGLLKDGPDAAELEATTPKWSRILSLRALSQQSNRPLLETALQFCLQTPHVTVTLLGMRTEEHLRENLRCWQAPPLTPEEYTAARHHAHES
jgi:aryl-alcohol dehydrogenase-like predicted oxidoreductase